MFLLKFNWQTRDDSKDIEENTEIDNNEEEVTKDVLNL